jgi:hypothetical protein
MGDIVFRTYRPGDETAINDGFNRVFGVSRSLDEWRWKYPAKPEGFWILLACDSNGTLLVHYGVIPVRLQAGAVTFRGGQIVDVYSVEGARQGLATARTFIQTVLTFRERLFHPDKLGLVYGFPGVRHLKLGLMRTDYHQLEPQPVTVWRRDVKVRGPVLSRYTVRTGFDPAAVDALWTRARGRYALAGVRNSAWFGRRFEGRPGVLYHHLSVWRGERPHAWATVRVGAPVCYWADLVWDGEDSRALVSLDRAVARLARRASAGSVEMWLDADPESARTLTETGWQGAHHPDVRLVVRTIHPAVDPASVPGRFYVTMADADLV